MPVIDPMATSTPPRFASGILSAATPTTTTVMTGTTLTTATVTAATSTRPIQSELLSTTYSTLDAQPHDSETIIVSSLVTKPTGENYTQGQMVSYSDIEVQQKHTTSKLEVNFESHCFGNCIQFHIICFCFMCSGCT